MKLRALAIFIASLFGPGPGVAQQSQNHAPALPPVIGDRVANSSPEELRLEAEMLDGGAGCNSPVWTGKHTTVAEIVGGKVARIRIVRFAPLAAIKKADQISTVLSQVWGEQAEQPACRIFWDEGASWCIEAVLEFEDGRRGILVTDGSHVAVQDHEGHTNFMRVVPEAQ